MNVRWAKRLRETVEVRQEDLEGFECIQLPVDAVMEREESAFLREKETLLSQGVSFEVFESPLPRGIQVTERGFNMYSWTEYLHTAIRRIAELGCKVLVWDDGRSRILPIEGEVATLKEQFYQLVFLLCEISARYHITICLEPLSERRTNFLNSLKETVDCFSLIGSPNLSLAIGLRSLVELSVNFTDLLSYKDSIAHIHVENPTQAHEMTSPRSTDEYDYAPFFNAVQGIQYSGVLSLPSDADETALLYCKKLWE
jgi:sugar phosphate isomerase/epimerase